MKTTMRRAALVTCMFLASAWGLNPISEGSYALWPRSISPSDFRAEEGMIFSGGGAVGVPLAFAVRATPSLELGAGLQTHWGDGGDHIPYIPLGLKYQANRATTLNLDFLVATHGGEDGLRLGALTRLQHGARLSSTLSGQLGFFDPFVSGSGGVAMEGAWIPALRLFRGVSAQCGLIASSQTHDFNDYFALDLQPGVLVDLGRGSDLLAQVTLGLAGPDREDIRAQIALAEGF